MIVEKDRDDEWSVQTSKRSSLLSNDFKTITFSQIELFEIFFTFEDFYFVLNSCTRKWHSAEIESTIRETRWWWSKEIVMINESDDQFSLHKAKKCSRSSSRSHCLSSSNSFVLSMIIISCLSRWSYCAICLWKLFIMRDFMHFWECSVFYYQSFFISVSFERSTSSSLIWASLRCLNCSSSLITRKYLNILTINSKMFRKVIKLFYAYLFTFSFRRSSNFEQFNNVWCIVCLRASQEHLENSIVFILWR
jgi:hypothetical protein